MSAKTILHQAKLNEWASRISDQMSSGLNVSQWCIRNGLTKDQFFYWKRKLKDELITQALPDIVPLSLPASVPECNPVITQPPVPTPSVSDCTNCTTCTTAPSAKIHFGDLVIELDPSAPDQFIQSIIKAVRHA